MERYLAHINLCSALLHLLHGQVPQVRGITLFVRNYPTAYSAYFYREAAGILTARFYGGICREVHQMTIKWFVERY